MKKIILILVLTFGYNLNAQVGVGTTTPRSTLDVNGNLSVKVVSLNGGPSGNATEIDDGVYINLTPTVGNLEFILPEADEFPGRIYILRNISDTEIAQIYSFDGSFFSGESQRRNFIVLVSPGSISKM